MKTHTILMTGLMLAAVAAVSVVHPGRTDRSGGYQYRISERGGGNPRTHVAITPTTANGKGADHNREQPATGGVSPPDDEVRSGTQHKIELIVAIQAKQIESLAARIEQLEREIEELKKSG